MISESEVLGKIKNQDLIAYCAEFPKLTGLDIRFKALEDARVRAKNEYRGNSTEFTVFLGNRWREMDLAHELMHGKIMFIDKYGIISCSNALCQLLRDYVEDIVVHREMLDKFKIRPFDEGYLSRTRRLAKDLFRGKKGITDEYWDEKGLDCKELHKALLYVQACSFNYLLDTTEFDKFLVAFWKTYQRKRQMELAHKIVEICKSNNYLNDKSSYDNALKEIIEIDSLSLPSETSIKHYKRSNRGFVLR